MNTKIWVLSEIAWGKKDATGMDPESGGVEIQPATVKVDRNLETVLVPEAISPFLDCLDLGVQPFTHGIGDWMYHVRQDIGQVALDQVSHRSHRLQAAVGGSPEPAFLEGFGFLKGDRLPKRPKLLLHGPGPTDFQVQGTKGLETASLGLQQVLLRIQPEILGAFRPSLPGLLLPDGVHRLAHMPHDVEVVEDDFLGRFGKVPEGALEEGIPHVHGDRPDLRLLLRGQRPVERLQGFDLPSLAHVFDSSLPKIADQRHVPVSLGNGLFIHPDRAQGSLFLWGQAAPFHRPFMDPPRLVPADPEKSCLTGNVTRFQSVDRQALEQLGEPSPGFGPGNRYLPDSVCRTGDPGNPGMEIGEELAAVQMPPDPLLRMIKHRKLHSAFRAVKQNLRRMSNHHVHQLRHHRPSSPIPRFRGPRSPEILVQFRVSHRPFLLHGDYR